MTQSIVQLITQVRFKRYYVQYALPNYPKIDAFEFVIAGFIYNDTSSTDVDKSIRLIVSIEQKMSPLGQHPLAGAVQP